MKRAFAALLGACLCLPAQSAERSVFVQLFEWRWADVALECEQVLAGMGISAVQVSPPNDHVDHRSDKLAVPYAWWARYQPVSYELVSRSGDEAAFRDMVKRCAAVGVGIYVDAVLNHMGDQVGKGISGATFDRRLRRYPDFEDRHFNRFCKIDGDDYGASEDPETQGQRAERLRRCQLLDLPDLDNSHPEVRARQVAYLQGLLDMGVAGFRIDAAKHMFPEDIRAILGELRGDFYVFQEVVDTRGEPVGVFDYVDVANVTEFLYSKRIGEAFASGDLASLKTLDEAGGLMPSDKAVVFVDNHDNQRGHGMAAATTHRDRFVYRLANVFMLAWPYGYPKLMSSYFWDGVSDSAGPPHDGRGNTLPVYGNSVDSTCGVRTWVCEHREGATMVRFRNSAREAGAKRVQHWWDNGGAQAAFAVSDGEESYGFVAINRDTDTRLTKTLATGMPPGRYHNRFAMHQIIEVGADGRASVDVRPLSALVLERDYRECDVRPGRCIDASGRGAPLLFAPPDPQ